MRPTLVHISLPTRMTWVPLARGTPASANSNGKFAMFETLAKGTLASGTRYACPVGRRSMLRLLVLFPLVALIIPIETIRADTAPRPLETLVPVDGPPTVASLVSIEPDMGVILESDAGPTSVAADQFIRWGTPREPRKGAQVLLANDGGLLVGDVVSISGERLLLVTDLWNESSLPIELVRGIVFWPPADVQKRDRLLDRINNATGQSDQILLENGDVIQGTIVGLNDERINIEVGTARSELPRERVTAIIFDPSLSAAPGTADRHALVGFADGTCLKTNEVRANNARVHLRLPGGVTLSSADDIDATTDLIFLMPFGPHLTYVSDLKPLDYKHIPYLDLPWDYGVNRNVLGGRLRSGGHVHIKGLGMHSTSRLAYALDRPYSRFEANVAIDDDARGGGSVIFRVLRDTPDGKWQDAYRSPIIRGGTASVPVQVDVTGARRVVLIVEFADRADQLDHADWLDARLIP